ncbi:MAG TPA: tetratricopeptide repeat protein [Burkholderiales bacterium]|nr:tetratricopeptide repeat protein [Burkholderiales bacterium]
MVEREGKSWGWRRVASMLALAVLPGWSSAQQAGPLPNPISAPGAAWGFDGFSVSVPADDGWYSLEKDAHYAELAKAFAGGMQGAVVVDAHRVDEDVTEEAQLVMLLRKVHGAAPDDATMKLTGYSAEPFAAKAALCARFSVSFDDRRPRYSAPGVLIARGVSCVRPGAPDMLITLKYTQRSAAVDLAPELSKVAEPFLASARFPASDPSSLRKARLAAGQTPEEAIQLLTPQAEQGDAEAAQLLGNMYLYGRGVPRDYQAARKWLELAAKEGHAEALYNLGAIYDKALGVDRDARQAINWFTLAADQRDSDAQLNLALFYIRGDGVPKNIDAAELWLQRSAGNGNSRARRILSEGKYKQQ